MSDKSLQRMLCCCSVFYSSSPAFPFPYFIQASLAWFVPSFSLFGGPSNMLSWEIFFLTFFHFPFSFLFYFSSKLYFLLQERPVLQMLLISNSVKCVVMIPLHSKHLESFLKNTAMILRLQSRPTKTDCMDIGHRYWHFEQGSQEILCTSKFENHYPQIEADQVLLSLFYRSKNGGAHIYWVPTVYWAIPLFLHVCYFVNLDKIFGK